MASSCRSSGGAPIVPMSNNSNERKKFQLKYEEWIQEDQNNTQTAPFRIFEQKEGDYYTLYGDNAIWLADEFFQTRDVLRNTDSLAYAHVAKRRIHKLLQLLLLEKQKSCHLYTINASGEWICVKKASPGSVESINHLLYDDCEASVSSVVMAVKINMKQQQREIGLSFVDVAQRRIGVCQFDDDENLSNFESILLQHGANECIVMESVEGDRDFNFIQHLLDTKKVTTTVKKRAYFQSTDIEQNLSHLVGDLQQHILQLQHKHAMSALAALIKHLDLIATSCSGTKFELAEIDSVSWMKLDTSAARALHLFPRVDDAQKTSSVFGLLNRCQTASGARLLRQFVKQPLVDVVKINARHDLVAAFVSDPALCDIIGNDNLKRTPDLNRLSTRLSSKKSTLSDAVGLYNFVVRLPSFVTNLNEFAGDKQYAELLTTTFTEPITRVSNDFAAFENMIEQSVDLEAVERHEFVVNPSFSDDLATISDDKTKVFEQIEDVRISITEQISLNDKQVKLNMTDNLGYHLRISRKDEKVIRGNPKFINLETRKDGVRFTTIALKRLSKSYAMLSSNYDMLQQTIVDKLLSVTRSYCVVLSRCTSLLSKLDVFVSLATVALHAPIAYVRPHMQPLNKNDNDDDGVIELRNARHPCMEMKSCIDQPASNFIPNDVTFTYSQRFHIISGPNMGGKSTYIRSVGIIVLMAQCGSFVPCLSATISVRDSILARVGAGDSQSRGLSTFMQEMLEAQSILKSATKNSLIIIDELGRGTSTYDGFGLAWAISEYIAVDIGCYALFATHFHELADLANHVPTVINRHVTADTDSSTITMLYEIRDGASDRSFGIHVAKLAQFPDQVIQMAKRKVDELEEYGQNDIAAKRHQKHSVVEAFSQLPLATMSDDEVIERVEKILAH